MENAPLSLAVIDLESGGKTDMGNKSEYPAVIASIESIERLPDANVTPAQSAEFQSDQSFIDSFFNLQSPPSCSPSTSTATREAAAAWFTEPDNTISGVVVAPLRTAVGDLQLADTEDPSDTGCYPAAIDDLTALESATQDDIAASAAPEGNYANTPFGDEIGYLNRFFGGSPSGEPLTEPCPTC